MADSTLRRQTQIDGNALNLVQSNLEDGSDLGGIRKGFMR